MFKIHPVKDSQNAEQTQTETQKEIPPIASVVTDEPRSKEILNDDDEEKRVEKEEFEARSLEVFERLFKSPVKCNFPIPNSAMNASVFEASNPTIPG